MNELNKINFIFKRILKTLTFDQIIKVYQTLICLFDINMTFHI